jgi:hypothetical protein
MSLIFNESFRLKLEYLKPTKDEIKSLILYCSFLSILFSIFFLKFEITNNLFLDFIFRFIFLFVFFYFSLVLTKYHSLNYGILPNFYLTKFNRYYIYPWSELDLSFKELKGGIYSLFLSLILFIFSFGLIIYPGVFNFKIKKIPKYFIGIKKFFEDDYYEGISEYRKSRVFFHFIIYLFLFLVFLKFLSLLFNFNFKNSYSLMLLYILVILFVPIPGSIGYEIYSINIILWLGLISVILPCVLILFILENLFLFFIFLIIFIIVFIFLILWNHFMKWN